MFVSEVYFASRMQCADFWMIWDAQRAANLRQVAGAFVG